MPNPTPQKGSSSGPGEKKKPGAAGCLVLLVLVVLALLWRCIPDSHPVWEGTVTPPGPTDFPQPPKVPTYDVEYLRWAGTLAPGQFALWAGIALPNNAEVPVGGTAGAEPPCTVYGNVKVLAGESIPFVIFDEANYRTWREGGKATARALMTVSPEKDYAIAVAREAQYLVVDNRKGTGEVRVGLTGIQSCLRSLQPGESPLQAQPRPTATWRLREEKLTLFGYLLRLLGGAEESQVMTPPEIH